MTDFEAPVLLSEKHDFDDFGTGEAILDEWLKKRASSNQQLGASRTFVICPKQSQKVIGFYSLSMGQIIANDTIGSMRRNMPAQIPAVILGRLAIDLNWQRKGLGSALIFDCMRRSLRASEEVAARLVIVHAISQAAEEFYKRQGFTKLPAPEPTLAIDLVRYRSLLQVE